MAEQSNEIKKLTALAADVDMPGSLRTKAIEQIGNIGTHEALLALLGLAAMEKLSRNDRELTLKMARQIIRSGG